jgi:hypothetical protein
MVRNLIVVLVFLIGLIAILAFSGPHESPRDKNQPDLIVAFSGDLDSYLEECG